MRRCWCWCGAAAARREACRSLHFRWPSGLRRRNPATGGPRPPLRWPRGSPCPRRCPEALLGAFPLLLLVVLLTHRRAVARPPCRAAMAPQVNLRMGKPGGLPWGSPAPKFGGGVIGGDCVVSAMIEQNLTLFDAKKAQEGAYDHDYDPHLRFGLRKEIRSRDSPLE